jgi:hypothetical protein
MTGDTPHMAEYLKFTFCFNADSKWNGAYWKLVVVRK